MKTPALKYRPEIDGLRAVAVLLVILNHFGVAAITGGFIGVDVFFVISGYLITSIVANEMREGTFSFREFYKRRIIRLAPAYFLVLATTSVAGLLLLMPQDLVAYSKSVIFSTLFTANYYLWRVLGDYFGATPRLIPLLHLWSLAVEEQFYIFWPPALLILYKVIVRPQRILAFVVFFALVSLCLSEWWVNGPHFGAAYYFMPTRAFELLIGAGFALGPKVLSSAIGVRQIFTLTGALLIAVPAFTYSETTAFPGINALLPCLGTVFVIAFSDGKRELAGRFLSSIPMNVIGRISYPAYLWHWPIVAFLNIAAIQINTYVTVTAILITLMLSALTYWRIEKPAKAGLKLPFSKVAGYGFLIPAILFIAFSLLADRGHGWPSRFDPKLIAMSNAIYSGDDIRRSGCLSSIGIGSDSAPPLPENCILGLNKPGVDILLVGDSHAASIANALDVMALDAGLRGYELTQKGTVYLPDARAFSYYDDGGRGIGREMKNFYERNKYIQQEIKSGKYRYVVLSGAYALFSKNTDYYLNGDVHVHDHEKSNHVFMTQMEQAIREIIQSGARPVIVNDNPYYNDGIERCSLNNRRFNAHNKCDMDIAVYQSQFREWDTMLEGLLIKYPTIKLIDPNLVICDEQRCHTELMDTPLYNDSNHISGDGATLIGKLYLERYGNPFKG